MSIRCTCDCIGESPCKEHGYGQLECGCGLRFTAPLVAKSFLTLLCPHCGQHYVGYEENCGNGCWKKITRKEYCNMMLGSFSMGYHMKEGS